MASVSSMVREIVSGDPYILECVGRGVVNYSALSRSIAREIEASTGSKPSIAAVKMALMRLSSRLSRGSRRAERVIAYTTLAVQDSIAVVTVPREGIRRAFNAAYRLAGSSRFIQVVQGLRTATIFVAREDLGRVLSAVGEPLEVIDGQAAIILVSPRDIVETPGVISLITSYLARNGINITQIISCHLETIIIVDSRDAVRAYRALQSLVEYARRSLASGGP